MKSALTFKFFLHMSMLISCLISHPASALLRARTRLFWDVEAPNRKRGMCDMGMYWIGIGLMGMMRPCLPI